MPREYTADELLPLSGIQHFLFCRRQWALIYVETQWRDNVLTIEGHLLHQRVDDPFFTETRNGVIIARAVPIASYTLGLSGLCDVVEFSPSCAQEGVQLPGREGYYAPAPVEYKRGRPKREPTDEAQLCAQAMCLEEMLSVSIPRGYLYYGQTRHREEVELSSSLRNLVREICLEMHAYFARGHTPTVRKQKGCRSCSMLDVCMPAVQDRPASVAEYIRRGVQAD
ncbi:MAG: CRISPR-associated protein Cas4 [Anaerolineae bacterium]|nr:CRISPR-associated protein Cas4 [Thermoflexales bacterium]MDW8407161.1 CRISPR-associated protein Cas4 [Anaerolineae bacterium]